ncbi:MAG: glycoside-pentoside-hexuronide (GPH):cation symporter [Lachnospiraceae bacterium]|nr:glycoside-pentoside-hexuronide (GPH):cation symporter [Lachnospiraceae bacterium]
MNGKNANAVDTRTTVGYAFGEFGSQFSWYMINSYLMIFYTDIVGLAAGTISLIMLIARVWDAVNDPMMGMLCDRTNTKYGRFRPYIMFAPPFLAIFNILTFTVFPLEGVTKALVCLVCYVGTGMLYTIVATAYASMVNVIANTSEGRTKLKAARNFGNAASQIILSAIAMPLILYFGQSDVATAKGYFWTVVVLSVIMIPCFVIVSVCCKEKYVPKYDPQTASIEKKRSIGESVRTILKNDQLVIVVINTLGGTIGIMGRMSLLAYYVIYVVGSYTMIAPIYVIMNVGNLLGSALIPAMTRRFGKRNYAVGLNILMIVSFVLMYMFPVNNVLYLGGMSFLVGVSNSAQGVIYGMVSDSIDYGEWKTGNKEVGLSFSFLSLSVKIATAVCGSVGVLLLAASGYVANAQQTAEAMNGINLVVNIFPAVCVGISLIPMLFYKLSNEKMAQIAKDLAERNGAKA